MGIGDLSRLRKHSGTKSRWMAFRAKKRGTGAENNRASV